MQRGRGWVLLVVLLLVLLLLVVLLLVLLLGGLFGREGGGCRRGRGWLGCLVGCFTGIC